MDCMALAGFTHTHGQRRRAFVKAKNALSCYQPKSSFFTKILVDSNAFGGSAALSNARTNASCQMLGRTHLATLKAFAIRTGGHLSRRTDTPQNAENIGFLQILGVLFGPSRD
jgi:hypothetical protein